MSFRSRFHHVHLKPMKDDQWFKTIRPKPSSWDSNHLDASVSFVAVPYEGGGGCVAVFDLTKPRRVEVHKRISAHDSEISDLKFSPFHPDLLMTGSNDSTLRLWKIPAGGLTQNMSKSDYVQGLEGHRSRITNIMWHPTCSNVFASGNKDKTVKLWDVEKGECKVDIPMKKNPLHICFINHGNAFLVGCEDKNMYVVDPRSSSFFVGETKVFASAQGLRNVYLPDKDMVVCTGSERGSRSIKLFDMKDLSRHVGSKELDRQHGVNMLFYDEDLGIIYTGGKGEGMIRYFDTQERSLHQINAYQSNLEQKGLVMVHKLGLNTLDHEVGRFLKLTDREIVPIRVLFPRKSQVFQPELFPDTAGFQPTGTSSGYFAGEECKPLEKISLEPGKRPEGLGVVQQTTFEKQKVVPKKQDAPYEDWKKDELIKKLRYVEEKLKAAEEKLKKYEE